VFALTSIEHRHSIEGFGIVYLEASMHGLPIIAHATGGVPEAVRHGLSGLLVPIADREALTHAFQDLLKNPHVREELGAGGRAWAAAHTWHSVAHALYDGL
jgi:glycosyltransferase involved in cell wall biosynthesis